MNSIERVMAYAAAFEETYRDDDWQRLAPYFAEDAVYEVKGGPMACRIEGRDAILAGLEKSVNGFDRRLDARHIDLLEGPEVTSDADGEHVAMRWSVTYDRAGLPSLVLPGRTVATVVGDHIAVLVDEYNEEELADTARWLAEHGQDLDGSYV
jgi:ketosteroid isomerase-like protein